MGFRDQRIRQLVGTVAVACAVLASAPAARAADGMTSQHHFSFSAESARLGHGKLVLTGVETHGLLHHGERNSAARLSVRKFVTRWKQLGTAPYVAGTHEVDGARHRIVRPRPQGEPTYDPKGHRLTIPVDDRRSPRKLPNGRWVFAHRKAAPQQFVVLSRDFGTLRFTFSLPAVVSATWVPDRDHTLYTGTKGTATLSYDGRPIRSAAIAPEFESAFLAGQASPRVSFMSSFRWSIGPNEMSLTGFANWQDPTGATGYFDGLFGTWVLT